MYRITKQFSFEAAHHLPHLPEGHKCARPHGHSYRVQIILESPVLGGDGFVQDFADLALVGDWLAWFWDHRDLNALGPGYAPPLTTSEMLARFLFDHFKSRFAMLAEVLGRTPRPVWFVNSLGLGDPSSLVGIPTTTMSRPSMPDGNIGGATGIGDSRNVLMLF